MPFSKSFPRTIKGSNYPKWEDVFISEEEEAIEETSETDPGEADESQEDKLENGEKDAETSETDPADSDEPADAESENAETDTAKSDEQPGDEPETDKTDSN